jgi:hypothetical protein
MSPRPHGQQNRDLTHGKSPRTQAAILHKDLSPNWRCSIFRLAGFSAAFRLDDGLGLSDPEVNQSDPNTANNDNVRQQKKIMDG